MQPSRRLKIRTKEFCLSLIALLVLAGCAAPGARAPAEPELQWRTALVGETVRVEVTDLTNHYRVEQVELKGPAGEVYPAAELTRETRRDDPGAWGRPSVGLGGAFGSGGYSSVGLGLGLSFPLGRAGRPEAVTRTEARIELPDPGAYARTAEDWRIGISLVDPAGASRVAEIPAPTPTG